MAPTGGGRWYDARVVRLATVLALFFGAGAGVVARADTDAQLAEGAGGLLSIEGAPDRAPAAPDPSFGPTYTIEAIRVVGNEWTGERLIRRALLLQEGDTLEAGDPRFAASRFRILALGYFSEVTLRLERGRERGQVVLVVEVVERGTFIVDRIFLGTSRATPVWTGLDVGDANFLGSGLGVGVAFVWAAAAPIDGAEEQVAFRLRYGDPSVLGSPLSVRAQLLYNDASEPYPTADGADEDDPAAFRAFRYQRLGGSAGVGYDLSRTTRLALDARYERIEAPSAVPAPPSFFPLAPGTSHVLSGRATFEWDTRVDPVLPSSGARVLAVVEAGADALGSSYDTVRLRARVEQWFPVAGSRHVVSYHLQAGLAALDPPGFDRFHRGDLNPLLPPRPLDLVVSTQSPFALFGDGAPIYGDRAASASLEYAYRLFRRPRRVYGGDLFVGAGLWGLGRTFDDLFVDVLFDAGLRLDTEIGVFELGIANALGRVPL